MRTVVLAWLLVAPAPEAVAIAWPDEATADTVTQQRLRDHVASVLGIDARAVQPDAVARARRLIAYEVERERMRVVEDAEGRLEAARHAFRAGELEGAGGHAAAILDAVRGDPGVPGAAGLAVQAELLHARIAWTRGDADATEAALGRALALDPGARISTRDVPPDFAAEYTRVQRSLLASASTWPRLELALGPEDGVEIDGRTGMRPVPQGEHFVVVRRLGAPPRAALVRTGVPASPGEATVLVGEGLPHGFAEAEQVCERLGVTEILLARERDDRLALQVFGCGRGFGPAWYSGTQPIADGVRIVFGRTREGEASFDGRSAAIDGEWPGVARDEVALVPTPEDGPPPLPLARPWFRRPWVWVVVGTAVVAGVTLGAVFGVRANEPHYVVRIPGDKFFRP